MTEKPTMTFEILERTIRSWQRKTFPKATAATIATHLVSEAVELARSLGVDADTLRSEVERAIAKPVRDKPEKECGDVFTLAIGCAGELGSDAVRVTLPVHQSNLGRTWGDVDPTTGIVEHVEERPSRHGDILADSFDRLMKCAVEIDDYDDDVEDDEDPTLKERPPRPRIGVAFIGTTPRGLDVADNLALLFGLNSLSAAPVQDKGVKGALQWAQDNARAVCIIGDEEVASGFVDVKLTDSGVTERVPLTAAGIKGALPWLKVSA